MSAWTVTEIIAKDGSHFGVWRVINPAGKTVWVTPFKERAETFAQFAPLIVAEFGEQTNITPDIEAVGSQK